MGLLSAILAPVTEIVGKFVPDKDLQARLVSELNMKMASIMEAEMDARKSIIMAEASGVSWLQRNIRPLSLLVFLSLLCGHWFGFTPPGITEAERLELFNLLQIGIGGYIGGRTAEKIAPQIVQIMKKKD